MPWLGLSACFHILRPRLNTIINWSWNGFVVFHLHPSKSKMLGKEATKLWKRRSTPNKVTSDCGGLLLLQCLNFYIPDWYEYKTPVLYIRGAFFRLRLKGKLIYLITGTRNCLEKALLGGLPIILQSMLILSLSWSVSYLSRIHSSSNIAWKFN